MNAINVIEANTDALTSQYALFGAALQSRYLEALEQPDPTNAQARKRLRATAAMEMGNALFPMMDLAAAYSKTIVDLALFDADPNASEATRKDAEDMLADRLASLRYDLTMMMDRDVQTCCTELRRFATQVFLLEQSERASHVGAIIRTKFAQNGEVKLRQPDRIGRKTSSKVAARLRVRQHLLLTHVETYLLAVARAGFTHVKLTHPDPTHSGHGRLIKIGGTEEGTYESIRDLAFHPNSRFVVEKVAA